MIDTLWSYAVLVAGSLFAILNPFATVPPFVAMTAANTEVERKAMAKRATLIALGISTVFALLGLRVLTFFGVSVPAFQIAGGLVLIRVAFDLLQGHQSLKITPEEHFEGTKKDDISITPLAVPLLCGPGSITTVVLLSSQAGNILQIGVLIAVIALVYAGILVLLRFVSELSHRLGDTMIKISSRLMGLILVAVAVQFVLEGIRAAMLF